MTSAELLRQLCSVPTAPFAERRVVQFVEAFVARRSKQLALARDSFGNLLITLRGREPSTPRWVFTAHMDHPGFVAARMADAKTLEADFYGYVRPEFFTGARVRFFEDEREVRATVHDFTLGTERAVPAQVRLKVARPVAAGSPGMFDLGTGRTRGKKFYSRVCDDLAGAAAALAMLDQLCRRPPRASVAVLLTRAEEEGFIGAIAASIKPQLLKKDDRLIAIECSAAQPYAPQGNGVVIRVGDRTSIFNSSLTYFLTEQAAALAKKDAAFKYQRALMPGGTCEATVYDMYGFTAAAVCVPLGNYHNMDVKANKLGAEFVDLGDWESMVKLFVALARNAHAFEPGMPALRQNLEKRFERMRPLLNAPNHGGS